MTTQAPDPIPLAAPDGTVYAWACAVCHHVSAGSAMLAPHGPEDIARLAESFRGNAAACCRCRKCGGVAPRWSDALRAVTVHDHCCEACWEGGERQASEERDAQWKVEREEADERYRASVARALDVGAALALEAEMRDISAEYFCAGWDCNLHWALWDAITAEPLVPYGVGFGEIDVATLQGLKDCAGRAGGWWDYRRFVPMDEWVAEFKAHEASGAGEHD